MDEKAVHISALIDARDSVDNRTNNTQQKKSMDYKKNGKNQKYSKVNYLQSLFLMYPLALFLINTTIKKLLWNL